LLSELFRNDYSTKADVYSFAISANEAITRRTPFTEYHWPVMVQNACLKGERPSWVQGIPAKVKSMVEAGWLGSPGERPSFVEIEIAIRKILEEVDTYPKLADLLSTNGNMFQFERLSCISYNYHIL